MPKAVTAAARPPEKHPPYPGGIRVTGTGYPRDRWSLGCHLGFTLYTTPRKRELLMPESESPPSPEPIPNDELKRAFKAFKKRLKIARLDDESSVGYGPMSKGGGSGIVAITPPHQYSKAVWEALVQQGKLKYATHGMYELVTS